MSGSTNTALRPLWKQHQRCNNPVDPEKVGSGAVANAPWGDRSGRGGWPRYFRRKVGPAGNPHTLVRPLSLPHPIGPIRAPARRCTIASGGGGPQGDHVVCGRGRRPLQVQWDNRVMPPRPGDRSPRFFSRRAAAGLSYTITTSRAPTVARHQPYGTVAFPSRRWAIVAGVELR